MKPIFEPGDFDGLPECDRYHVASRANAKLTSLGIDAETRKNIDDFVNVSEKREKHLERLQESLRWYSQNGNNGAKASFEIAGLKQRLTELERMIAEAPEIRGYFIGENFHQLCVHSVIYEHSITHCARLVQIEGIK